MTKDEVLKLAQEVCPYFDEQLQDAFYEGFIRALDQFPDTTKMIDKVSIKYWVQDTVESGRWVTTESMSKSTAKKLLSDEYRDAFPQGHIVEPPNSNTDVVESEPVAWCELNSIGEIMYFDGRAMIMPGKFGNDLHTVPLYAAPPKREWVGLTDEEILNTADFFGSFQYGDAQGHKRLEFARAIEQRLKEKNHD